MKWEERYSPSEMMYVEVTDQGVRVWLNQHRGDLWSFREVLDGAIDSEVGSVFGSPVLSEIKEEARQRCGGRSPTGTAGP
jgi:hypothetical protein